MGSRFLNWLIFFFLYQNIVFGQQQLKIKNEPLINVIQKVERATDLVFNYDPELLAPYQLNADLDWSDTQNLVQRLLYSTPLDFQVFDNTILIFLPEQQAFKICGFILDASTSNPLPYANIFTEDYSKGTQSDENGYFELAFAGYKNQLFTISYVGYNSISFMAQEMSATSCKIFKIGFDEALFGNPIVVTDYLLNGITEGETYSSTRMDYEKLAQNSANIDKDILKNVQLLPGISSIDGSATNIQIRGNTADQNLILWEGATLYNPGHFFGMISSVNPFVIDQVKIFKNAFESSYDNRVGGVIDMSLSDSIPKEISGGVGTTFSEAHAYLNLPILKDRFSIITSGRNTINSLFSSPTLRSYSFQVFQDSKVLEESDEEEERDQILNYYDWNLKALIRPFPNLLLKASILKTKNNFDYSISTFDNSIEINDNVLFQSDAVSLSARYDWNPNIDSKVAFNRSNYSNDYGLFYIENEDGLNVNMEQSQVFNAIWEQNFSFSTDWNVSEFSNFRFGYEHNQKRVNLKLDFRSRFEGDFLEASNQEGTFDNLFASFQYQKDKLHLNTGFRATYYQEAELWAVSPRLNIQYALNEEVKLKFSAAILQQFISQLREFGHNELALNFPVWVINDIEEEEEGNSQHADKISFGALYQKKGWLIDIEGYLNNVDGLSTLSPLFGNNEELDGDEYYSGSGRNIGLDFLLKKSWKFYDLWFNYSLSESLFEFPELSDESFVATNDQRHKLNIVNNFKLKDWNFTLAYNFKSALPFTPVEEIGSYFEEEVNETFYFFESAPFNSARLNNYSRLDFGISYSRQAQESGPNFEMGFSILNLLGRSNIIQRNYQFLYQDEDPNEEEEPPTYFSLDRVLIRRTPQLLIRLYW